MQNHLPVYYLGAFASMEEVWRTYPHGGHLGECLTVAGIDYHWDNMRRCWLANDGYGGRSYRLLQQTGDLHLAGQLRVGGKTVFQQPATFRGDVRIEGQLVCRHLHGRDCGLFTSVEALKGAYPSPQSGDWALVGDNAQPQLWNCTSQGSWEKAADSIPLAQAFDLEAYRAARDIVNGIAADGYVFCGIADPSTNPIRPADHNVFYLSSTPGEYVHFGGFHVRNMSVLMWKHDVDVDADGMPEGQWTARVLFGGVFVYGENIADDAVSLEKLTPGVRSIFTTLTDALAAESEARQQADLGLQTDVHTIQQKMVRSISVNNGAPILPDSSGKVNLHLRSGEGGDPDDLTPIYDRLDALEAKPAIVTFWQEEEPSTEDLPANTLWYDTENAVLKVLVTPEGASPFWATVQQPASGFYVFKNPADPPSSPSASLYIYHDGEMLPFSVSGGSAAAIAKLTAAISGINTAISGINTSLSSLDVRVTILETQPEPEPEPEPDFDPHEGNAGSFVIEKEPEDITPEDVTQAYTITQMKYTDENVFTAEELMLEPDTTYNSAKAARNATKIKAALENEKCTVIDLGHNMYPICELGAGMAVTNPSAYEGRSIEFKRDMRIVAGTDGNGAPDGGFISYWSNIFLTSYSLELENVRFIRSEAEGYLFMIDTSPGIDYVIVRNCDFQHRHESTSPTGRQPTAETYKSGRTFFFYRADVQAISEEGEIIKTGNYIRHILFEHNTCDGDLAASAGIMVTNTWRYVDNTFVNVRNLGIDHGAANNATYATEAAYASCPLYIVGNKFVGHYLNEDPYFYRDFTMNRYRGAALVESMRLYFLRNEVSDILGAYSARAAAYGGYQPTYDVYFQGRQIFFVKNIVKNLLRIADVTLANVGTLKGKGTATPARFKGQAVPMLRYYTHNQYLCQPSVITEAWEAQTYDGEYGTANADYDNTHLYEEGSSFNLEEWMFLQLGQFDDNSPTLAAEASLVFSNNIVDYPVLSGMPNASSWSVATLEVVGNQFRSKYVTSQEYVCLPRKMRNVLHGEDTSCHLFTTRYAKNYKISDNIFTAKASDIGQESLHIYVALHKYRHDEEGEVAVPTTIVTGNALTDAAGTMLVRRLDLTGFTWGTIYSGRGD